MNKLPIIVLFSLLLWGTSRAIAGQEGLRDTAANTPGAETTQSALATPLARLEGLDRLYFHHVGQPGDALKAPPELAPFLPELLRSTDSDGKTVKVPSFSEGLDVRDFHVPSDSPKRQLWIRQIIKADLPRFAELWWAFYEGGQRSDVWYFVPTPQFTESKILSNYEIVDASRAGNGAVALRIQGSQFRSQGAWSIVGKVLTFSVSNAGLALSYVRNSFGFFHGYDLGGGAPPRIDISTEQERQRRLEERTFAAVPKRVLRACRYRDPTEENWDSSWKELERTALCVTKEPGVKTTFRAFDEPSFVERGGRATK